MQKGDRAERGRKERKKGGKREGEKGREERWNTR